MPSLPIYVAASYVDFDYTAESIQQGRYEDFTWDQFAESEYIDRTWEEWYGDAWDYSAVAFSFSIISKATGGYAIAGASSLSTIATQADTTCNRLRFSGVNENYTSVSSFEGLGGFLTGGNASITASASQSTVPNRLRDQPTAQEYFSSFSTNFIGNYIFGPSPSLSALFSTVAQGNARFAPSPSFGAVFSQLSNGNYLIALLQPLELFAFASELTIGGLVQLPDPYYTIKALQELKVYVVPEESRIIELLQETRLNKTLAETRAIKVLEETRNYRVFTPPFKLRTQIPRVRGDY
jgi:hypothetical protein